MGYPPNPLDRSPDMPPKSWATPEQLQFFKERIQGFLAAQKANKVSQFMTETESEFFEKWPELTKMYGPDVALDDLTEEQMTKYGAALQKRKDQMRSKFYNDVYATRRDTPKALTLAALLPAAPPPAKRAPQRLEAYSKLYYQDKVKASVADATKDEDVPEARNINIVRRELASAFSLEPPEVQAEVQSYIQQQKAAIELAKKAAATMPSLANRTPEEYNSAIKELPQFLGPLLKVASELTGLSISCYGGGPWPEEGGALQTFSFHIGKTAAGHDFAATYAGHEKYVMQPFGKFLNAKYPPAERARRALPSGSRSPLVSADSAQVTTQPAGPSTIPLAPPADIVPAPAVVPPAADITAPRSEVVSTAADVAVPPGQVVAPSPVAESMGTMSVVPEPNAPELVLLSGGAGAGILPASDSSTPGLENIDISFMPIPVVLPTTLMTSAMGSSTLAADDDIFTAENIARYLPAPTINNVVFPEFNPLPSTVQSLPTSVGPFDAPYRFASSPPPALPFDPSLWLPSQSSNVSYMDKPNTIDVQDPLASFPFPPDTSSTFESASASSTAFTFNFDSIGVPSQPTAQPSVSMSVAPASAVNAQDGSLREDTSTSTPELTPPLAATASVTSPPATPTSTSVAAMSESMPSPEAMSVSMSTATPVITVSATPDQTSSRSPLTDAMQQSTHGGRPRRDRTAPKPADADWQPPSARGKESHGPATAVKVGKQKANEALAEKASKRPRTV
ncbi:uncharacterized protein B0H18DRAFT_1121046 [Fomitopsis serialis]|uniref:uncharacterized protein n=1 Tax=Fomitopsis serialis TaxID=139415 RepID=UPI00200889AD|nr:uncharacterized protein B0H18DRAFT_1121046 [Neoantrodia serialis]KAH9922229.1 hypothetical protein B0H18DRAFT_1121046 [Neoantrodia serialis]